jgi:hypothetical protein
LLAPAKFFLQRSKSAGSHRHLVHQDILSSNARPGQTLRPDTKIKRPGSLRLTDPFHLIRRYIASISGDSRKDFPSAAKASAWSPAAQARAAQAIVTASSDLFSSFHIICRSQGHNSEQKMQKSIAIVLLAVVAFSATPSSAAMQTFDTQAVKIRVEIVADGLQNPWGLDFLPNGEAIVTERSDESAS